MSPKKKKIVKKQKLYYSIVWLEDSDATPRTMKFGSLMELRAFGVQNKLNVNSVEVYRNDSSTKNMVRLSKSKFAYCNRYMTPDNFGAYTKWEWEKVTSEGHPHLQVSETPIVVDVIRPKTLWEKIKAQFRGLFFISKTY